MNRLLCSLWILGCLTGLVAETSPLLRLANDAIVIQVTDTETDKGRFSIETVGGDPSRKNDDLQPLIYGRPIPWTSFTTIRIEGQNYAFGGPTKKRAGKSLLLGNVTQQEVTNNAIVTTVMMNEIESKQRLSLFRNPLSRVMDTVLIEYEVTNTSTRSKSVGLRLMLDTMLGQNDGAPFRLKQHAYQSEQDFSIKTMASYWQAFDSLSQPNVIAQGVLSHPESGILPPDRLLLSNWGLLADHAWDFSYKEGRSFVREGELELDTALAFYWNETMLAPGETRRYQTLYGLGGVTLAPGQLSLGLAAASEFDVLSSEPQLLVAYVMNNGGYDSKNTKLSIQLPPGLKIIEGEASLNLGPLLVGESRQMALTVVPTAELKTGSYAVRVTVVSENLESNQLERVIDVLGPPAMELLVSTPDSITAGPLSYSTVNARVTNQSTRFVSGLTIGIDPQTGLRLPDFESITKPIDRLAPGGIRNLNWVVEIPDTGLPKREFSMSLQGPSILTQEKSYQLTVEPLSSSLSIESSHDVLYPGDVFFLDLKAFVPMAFRTGILKVKYEKDKVMYVRQSLHPSFATSRSLFEHQAGHSLIKNLDYTAGAFSGTLFKLHFLAKEPGTVLFELYNDGQVVSKKMILIEKKESK